VFPEARYRLDVCLHVEDQEPRSFHAQEWPIQPAASHSILSYREVFSSLSEAGHLQRATSLARDISSRGTLIEVP
jgi:hypothetical protein